jgi:hypothetical protein
MHVTWPTHLSFFHLIIHIWRILRPLLSNRLAHLLHLLCNCICSSAIFSLLRQQILNWLEIKYSVHVLPAVSTRLHFAVRAIFFCFCMRTDTSQRCPLTLSWSTYACFSSHRLLESHDGMVSPFLIPILVSNIPPLYSARLGIPLEIAADISQYSIGLTE